MPPVALDRPITPDEVLDVDLTALRRFHVENLPSAALSTLLDRIRHDVARQEGKLFAYESRRELGTASDDDHTWAGRAKGALAHTEAVLAMVEDIEGDVLDREDSFAYAFVECARRALSTKTFGRIHTEAMSALPILRDAPVGEA